LSILEKCNPQKFLISVFFCILRGELFFTRGVEHKEIARCHVIGNICHLPNLFNDYKIIEMNFYFEGYEFIKFRQM